MTAEPRQPPEPVAPPASGQTPALSDAMAREAGMLLFAADSIIIGDRDDAEKALAFTRRWADAVDTDPIWAGGEHCGDCTKQPMTCARCVIEKYEDTARLLEAGDYDIPDSFAALQAGASTPDGAPQ